jgi:hypothetical protein
MFINFLKFVRPICLPKEPSNDADKYEGQLVHLIGWGSSSDIHGKASMLLKRAVIKVFSQRFDFFSFSSSSPPCKVGGWTRECLQ